MIFLSLLLLAADPRLEHAYQKISELRRAGQYAAAAEAFEKLANENTESDLSQRALTTAAEIYQWNLGDVEKARALYDRVLLAPSDRRGVMPALVQRLNIERELRGLKAELELARALEARQPIAEYAPWLLLREAKILADELNDPASAIGLCERVRGEHLSSTYLDDALFFEARLLRAVKRPREAIGLYGAIIASKQKSLIVGSYDSTYLDDAYFQVAETLRADLREAALAERAYLELVDAVPLSVFVDDALRQAILLARARGDAKKAAEYLARLRELRPGSRYL